MKIYEVGYNRYNITMEIANNEILVASLRDQLIELDYVYLTIEFPYNDSSEIRIPLNKYNGKELIELIKKIVLKKMYKIQQDILNDMNNIENIEYNENGKEINHYNFSKGTIYGNKLNIN